MGRRVDIYDYYAYVAWDAGTWVDIYYWGGGYLTVRAWAYQSEVVKIFSPNTPFHHLDAQFSAWGGRIDALPWSSKIDIYGLAWTWVKLNADANGGKQEVTVSSPGTNEVWTGDGNDIITVKTGGRYTFIDTGYGWDTVNLGDGIDTYVYKRDGSLSLNPSSYRSGLTQIRTGHLDNLYVTANSYSVDLEASSVNKYARADIYGLGNVRWWTGGGSGRQILTLSSPGKVEVWTGDGDDSVDVQQGGRYTFVELKDGWDTLNLGSGIDTYVYKRNGSLSLNPSQYRSGFTQIRAGNLEQLYVTASSYSVDLEANSINKYARADIYGLGNVRWWTGGGSGRQNLTLSSPGKVEVWTGDGDDSVDVQQGGIYTFIELKDGWDIVNLGSGIDTYIYKGNGRLTLSDSQYRSGLTQVKSSSLRELNVNLRSYSVSIESSYIQNYADADIYGLGNVWWWTGSGRGRQNLTLSSPGKIEVWTGDGDDSVSIKQGGRYTYVDLKDGNDLLTIMSGIDVLISKNSGSLDLSIYQYLSGTFKLYSKTVDINSRYDINAYGVHLDIRDRVEKNINKYLGVYALGWSNFHVESGKNKVLINAFGGTSNNSHISGQNFLRVKVLGSASISDWGGSNSYVLGKQYGPATVWSELNLNANGYTYIHVLGESIWLNNEAKTGGQLILNSGGVYKSYRYYKGENGLVYNTWGGWMGSNVHVGEDDYAYNYIISSYRGPDVQLILAGTKGQVLDASTSAHASFKSSQIGTEWQQSNHHITLSSGKYDFSSGYGDIFVAFSHYTNKARVFFGKNSTLELNVLTYIQPGKEIYILQNKQSIIVKVGEETVISILKESSVSPSTIILNLGSLGSTTINSTNINVYTAPVLGSNNKISYLNSSSLQLSTDVYVDAENHGAGWQSQLFSMLQSRSLLRLNDRHGFSENGFNDIKAISVTSFFDIPDLKNLSLGQALSAANNIFGKSFWGSITKDTIKDIHSSFFGFAKFGFYDVNKHQQKLINITVEQASEIPTLTSVQLFLTKSIFDDFSKPVQDQIIRNLAGKIQEKDIAFIFNDPKQVSPDLIDKLDINVVKSIVDNKNLLDKLTESQKEQIDQMLLRDKQDGYKNKYFASWLDHTILLSGLMATNPDTSNISNQLENWHPVLNLGSGLGGNLNGWLYLSVTTTLTWQVYMAEVLELNFHKLEKKYDLSRLKLLMGSIPESNIYYRWVKEAYDEVSRLEGEYKKQLGANWEYFTTTQGFRHDAAFLRLFGGVTRFALALSKAMESGDDAGIALYSTLIVWQVFNSAQVPSNYFIQAATHEGNHGGIAKNSFKQFVDFYNGKTGVESLWRYDLNLPRDLVTSRRNQSVIRSLDDSLANFKRVMDLQGNGASGAAAAAANAASEAVAKPKYSWKMLRQGVPTFIFEVNDIGGLAIDAYFFALSIMALEKMLKEGKADAQAIAEQSLRVLSGVFGLASGIALVIGDGQGFFQLLIERGFVRNFSKTTLTALEGGAYGLGGVLLTIVFVIEAIADLVSITSDHIFLPVLSAIQSILYAVMTIVAFAVPPAAPLIFLAEFLLPSFQSIGLAVIQTDQVNLIKIISAMIGSDPSTVYDTKSGYVESCAQFKSLYILADALLGQLVAASMPLGFILGPIGREAMTTTVKNKIFAEPDFWDAPGTNGHAQFNFMKTVMGESVIFNFYAQGVDYLKGGDGLINWLNFEGKEGSRAKIQSQIDLLKRFYKSGTHFLLNVSLGGHVTYSNGNPIGEGSYLVLSDIGVYVKEVKIEAPTHMYHEAQRISDKQPIDFTSAYLRISSLDKNIGNKELNALSFGLQGESVKIGIDPSFSLNLFIIGDVNNSKNKTQTITITGGMVSISVFDSKAQKNTILKAGEGFNSLYGAKEMYGHATGMSGFLISSNTKHVEGGLHGRDSLGTFSSFFLRKLDITEDWFKAYHQYDTQQDTSVSYTGINNYLGSSPVERVMIETPTQSFTSVVVTRHVSFLTVADAVHPYVMISADTKGSEVRFKSVLAEVSLASKGNMAILDSPFEKPNWEWMPLSNGDFSQSREGWSTDYKYGIGTPGSLQVEKEIPDWWEMGSTRGVNGQGHLLLVDGGTNPRQAFWRNTQFESETNTLYRFSFWMLGNDRNLAKVQLWVNGEAVDSYASTPASDGWSYVSYAFKPKMGGEASWLRKPLKLELVNLETSRDGNDFAIGEIKLEKAFVGSTSTPVRLAHYSVVNGSFENGWQGFSTQYKQAHDGYGSFKMISTLSEWWGFSVSKAHTGNQMMLVDGSSDPKQYFWQELLDGFEAGQEYIFSFAMAGTDQNPAKVQLNVNGVDYGNPVSASAKDGWKIQNIGFKSPTSGPLQIQLRDSTTGGAGNDFLLDSFQIKKQIEDSKIDQLLPKGAGPKNLISNGEFDDGLNGFGSQYKQGDPARDPGSISVQEKTNILKDGTELRSVAGEAAGSGKFLLVRGGGDPNTSFLSKTVIPQAVGEYVLKFVVAGKDKINDRTSDRPKIDVKFNGESLGPYAAFSENGGWHSNTIFYNVKMEQVGKPVKIDFYDKNQSLSNDNILGVDQVSMLWVEDPYNAQNLLKNGEFEQGTADWGSDYRNGLGSSGSFSVQKQTPTGWKFKTEQSPDNSNFLAVESGNNPNQAFWKQELNLSSDKAYTFSLGMMDEDGRAKIRLKVNGVDIGSPFSVSPQEGWRLGAWSFKNNHSGPTKLELVNLETSGSDKFAVDKLRLYEVNATTNNTQLLVNGDFSQGYFGWSGDYHYGDYLGNGHAAVVKEAPSHWGLGATKAPDGGNFLMVDGATKPQQAIWRERVYLEEGKHYTFSYDLMGVDLNREKVKLYVDGNAEGGIGTVYKAEGWKPVSTIFKAHHSGYTDIKLVNLETTSSGNDFALDNLRLVETKGPLVLSALPGNQLDGYEARVDATFKLRSTPEPKKLTPTEQAVLDAIVDKIPPVVPHSPTENQPWTALGGHMVNNEYQFRISDLLKLDQAAEIYLSTDKAGLWNKINLATEKDTAKDKDLQSIDRSKVYVDYVRAEPDFSNKFKVVGDHPFKTNQFKYEVYVEGKNVLDVYSLAGTQPDIALFVDYGIVYQNNNWA